MWSVLYNTVTEWSEVIGNVLFLGCIIAGV